MFLLLMVIAILPSSYAYVDCKTACRHCRENREHATLLEVHCAMCRECKLRRKGMQQSQVTQSTVIRPLLPRQRLRKPTPSHAVRMQEEEQEHVAHEEYGDYPEGCPTPPECESEEEIVTLRVTTTTATISTTTTIPTTTCPPIPMCKKKRKRHTQAQPHHCALPVCATTTCTPCTPRCPLPCVQYQTPVTDCHSPEPLKLTYTTQPPTQAVYVPTPTEVKTQVLFQQSVNQLLIQQSAQQAVKASQGQQQALLQKAANQALQSASQNQQQLLLQQAIQSLNQAMQSNQGQNQVVNQQPGQNQVTVSQMRQPTLQSAGTPPDYYYLYLGVPNNMMNKD